MKCEARGERDCGKALEDGLKNLGGLREATQGFDCRNDIISSAELS